jgi:hypothetical protein
MIDMGKLHNRYGKSRWTRNEMRSGLESGSCHERSVPRLNPQSSHRGPRRRGRMTMIKGQLVTKTPKSDRNSKSEEPESAGFKYLPP